MRDINIMTGYEIDEEIAHLERLSVIPGLTQDGSDRLIKLKLAKRNKEEESIYSHDEDSDSTGFALGMGLGSLLFGDDDSGSGGLIESGLETGGGTFGGAGAGSDY